MTRRSAIKGVAWVIHRSGRPWVSKVHTSRLSHGYQTTLCGLAYGQSANHDFDITEITCARCLRLMRMNWGVVPMATPRKAKLGTATVVSVKFGNTDEDILKAIDPTFRFLQEHRDSQEPFDLEYGDRKRKMRVKALSITDDGYSADMEIVE